MSKHFSLSKHFSRIVVITPTLKPRVVLLALHWQVARFYEQMKLLRARRANGKARCCSLLTANLILNNKEVASLAIALLHSKPKWVESSAVYPNNVFPNLTLI